MMGSSDPDLYPPDVEDVDGDARDRRNRAAIGTFLVVFGSGLLLERALDVDLDYFMLALGAGALAGWVQVHRYPWFVAGAVLTGDGLGDLIGGLLGGWANPTVTLLGLAAGFLAVYVRYPWKSTWALVPAAIFAVLAVGSAGIGLIGLLPGAVAGLVLPLVLIAGGTLLVFRGVLPGSFVRAGLVVLGLVFVLVAMSRVDEIGGDWDFGHDRWDHEQVLPFLEGRALVVETRSGDVDVRPTSGPPRIESTRPVAVDPSDEEVRVTVRSTDLRVFVPADADLAIETDSGEIEVDGEDEDSPYSNNADGPEVRINTESGDVDVEGMAA